ncbi:LytTR family DNA-binding domain-containing protein [Peptoniphilus porci]|nr:LytTR family DNA-binding domain-containing protein [Peptoniphilus porci]
MKGAKMDFEIIIDENFHEPKTVIYTNEITEDVLRVKNFVLENSDNLLIGFFGSKIKILKPSKIYRIYTEDSKIFAESIDEKYLIKKRIYQLEDELKSKKFVRISNSELINLNLVESFDLSYSGTISVRMRNNSTTFVSRRYVKKIKNILGV